MCGLCVQVDKGSKGKFSGSSFYYGSSSLYYLTADGSFECAVPLEKEGPVQDVAWVPGNMQFVVLCEPASQPASQPAVGRPCAVD